MKTDTCAHLSHQPEEGYQVKKHMEVLPRAQVLCSKRASNMNLTIINCTL